MPELILFHVFPFQKKKKKKKKFVCNNSTMKTFDFCYFCILIFKKNPSLYLEPNAELF